MSQIRDIYNGIVDALGRRDGIALVKARYFPEIFGNFIISFTIADCGKSFVNERFQLFLCDQLGGEGDRKSIVRDIREIGPSEVLRQIEPWLH